MVCAASRMLCEPNDVRSLIATFQKIVNQQDFVPDSRHTQYGTLYPIVQHDRVSLV